mmetsp:Transcript_54454/g.165445  ORF Transcript_54454/g.165445 Transcript_54454/m.165445 type:complete len:333 (-) Transcript_54454:438-1436(-)
MGPVIWYAAQWYVGAIVCVTSTKFFVDVNPQFVKTITLTQSLVCVVCARLWITSAHAAGDRPGSDGVSLPGAAAAPPPRGGVTPWRAVPPRLRLLIVASAFTWWGGFCLTYMAFSMMHASVVEIVKATEAFPTVMLAALFVKGGGPTVAEVLALGTIVAGVCFASCGEGTYSAAGILATLLANLNFAACNLCLKVAFGGQRYLNDANMLYRICQFAMLFELCGAAPELMLGLPHQSPGGGLAIASLLLVNGVSNFVHSRGMVMVCKHVRLSAQSAINCVRRGVLTVWTALFFGTGISVLNGVGIGVTILGVFLFETLRSARVRSPPKVLTRR